jgi:hypothetical protein
MPPFTFYTPEKHVKTSVNYKELVSSQVSYAQNGFYAEICFVKRTFTPMFNIKFYEQIYNNDKHMIFRCWATTKPTDNLRPTNYLSGGFWATWVEHY